MASYGEPAGMEYTLAMLKEFWFSKNALNYNAVTDSLFARIGYLDYATRIIADPDKYSQTINLLYYPKSIIDNILSPGGDLFDAPLVSNTIVFVDMGIKNPTHALVRSQYQSMLLTNYGEYYVLFGPYAGAVMLFFTAFIFKSVYFLIRSRNRLVGYLLRAGVLYLFYIWLKSFGIDWCLRTFLFTFGPICFFITVIMKKNYWHSCHLIKDSRRISAST